MRIGELAKRSGPTAHTLRYDERIGLLPFVERDAAGHRDYDGSILAWIGFLDRLKTTRMPIRTMLHYAALRRAGPATAPERRLLLERHRAQVRTHVAALQDALAALDTKIAGYACSTEGMHDDDRPEPDPGKPLRAGRPRAR
ncbi:MerR family transcriptional regulator [Methylobacterium sp. WL6]|uniref:MerR family transcriptional regulator n=1 Tax=Methylobacterium sp. WL6 TaxID=2603901 RepID=UPI0011CB503A|nr:MerR family transcriptional regulator [Methylobacterium sp. WL6]TXN61051.1 MerR family transcriptional regulator [Methylobacterium sp. WL6]